MKKRLDGMIVIKIVVYGFGSLIMGSFLYDVYMENRDLKTVLLLAGITICYWMYEELSSDVRNEKYQRKLEKREREEFLKNCK
jgi:hypothetical protein